MKKNNISILSIFCIIIFLLIGIFLYQFFIFSNIIKIIVFLLLYILPSIISSFIFYYQYKNKNKNKLYSFQICLIFLSIIYYIFLLIFSFYIMTIDGVDNPKRYNKIKSYYIFDYFPDRIPTTSKNVMLHQNFQLFQGADIFSLYFKSNDSFVKKYQKKYKEFKLDEEEKQKFLLSNQKRITLFTPYKEFKNINFDIYKLKYVCDDTSWCNHGMIEVIAINNEKKEIIFYYSNW